MCSVDCVLWLKFFETNAPLRSSQWGNNLIQLCSPLAIKISYIISRSKTWTKAHVTRSGTSFVLRRVTQVVHCSMFSHVNLSSCHVILQQSQANPLTELNEALSDPVQAAKDPILFKLPSRSFSFVCHSSSRPSQAICFKKGESNNSLALGLFS